MNFIDEVCITVRSGKGGDGSTSFHRAPYVPKGGPDGGDGGRGGSVILRATSHKNTLQDYANQLVHEAGSGKNGAGGKKSGRAGKDITIDLPIGTLVYDDESNELLVDLVESEQTFVVAKGGNGGGGNIHYATSRNRTPRKAGIGGLAEEKRLRLELKLLADVGLVGRPNAGKSTLLAALSRANPIIGSYPFSTLTPSLGVVQVGSFGRLVMADLPGIIEGSSEGRGLGHRFLRHIERTRLILMLIEAPEPDCRKVYNELVDELESFSPELAAQPRLVYRSKSDLPLPGGRKKAFKFDGAVSAVTGDGLKELVDTLAAQLGIEVVRLG